VRLGGRRLASTTVAIAMSDAASSGSLVSIGVPVYNGERYLGDCLASVRSQTHAELDIVISDSGSSDGTEEISREAVRSDSRIRYFRATPYRGVDENFNFAFEQARGGYFCWIASDDAYAPSFVERSLGALLERPELRLAFPAAAGIDEDWRVDSRTPFISTYRDDEFSLDASAPSERFASLLRGIRECNAIAGLFRREAIAATGLFAHHQGSDIVLLASVVLAGPCSKLPEPLLLRRIHEEQTSRTMFLGQADRVFNRKLPKLAYIESVHVYLRLRETIHRADIDADEKRRCLRALTRIWWPARRHSLRWEVGGLVRSLRRGAGAA
jgi:glycosyltransferase involved in cell wall biosynthesis